MCRSDVVGGALARAAQRTTQRAAPTREGGVRELAGKVCLLNECIYRVAVDDVLPCLVE